MQSSRSGIQSGADGGDAVGPGDYMRGGRQCGDMTPPGCGGVSEDSLKFGFKVGEFDQTYAALLKLSVVEEEHCGDIAHAVGACDFIIVVDVEFADYHVRVFFGKLLDHRTELDAGTAPCGLEVDYYGFS